MRKSISLESFMSTAHIFVFGSMGIAVLAYALFLIPAAGLTGHEYIQPLSLASYIFLPLVFALPLPVIWGTDLFFLAPPFSRHLLYRTGGEEFDEWCADYYARKTHELLTPYLERKRREKRLALIKKIKNRRASRQEIISPVAHALARELRDSLVLLGAAYFVFLCYLAFTHEPGFSMEFSAVEARNLAICVWSVAIMISALVLLEIHRAPALLYRFWKNGKTKNLLLCLIVLFASGCAGTRGPGGSFVGELPSGGAVQTIASEASGQISELYPPGHTKLFVLTPEKDAGNGFSLAFENALRSKGFTVLPLPNENAVAVAYVLDQLHGKKDGEQSWYLQLRISDNEDGGVAFARSYTADGRPEASRSKTDIPFSRSFASRMADKATRKASKAYNRSAEYLTE